MTLNVRKRRDRKRCRGVRVWLNGRDVTRRCFYADGRRGVVRLFRENAEGKTYLERVDGEMRVATEERRGHVRWGKQAACGSV
jgi:hypothetical protein